MPDDESKESTSGILFFYSHLVAQGLPAYVTKRVNPMPKLEIYRVPLISRTPHTAHSQHFAIRSGADVR